MVPPNDGPVVATSAMSKVGTTAPPRSSTKVRGAGSCAAARVVTVSVSSAAASSARRRPISKHCIVRFSLKWGFRARGSSGTDAGGFVGVRHQTRSGVHGRQADEHVDDPAQGGHRAEEGGHEVEARRSDETPVEATDDEQGDRGLVQRFHDSSGDSVRLRPPLGGLFV